MHKRFFIITIIPEIVKQEMVILSCTIFRCIEHSKQKKRQSGTGREIWVQSNDRRYRISLNTSPLGSNHRAIHTPAYISAIEIVL